ncbi:enoyl-CoA hydratase [Herbaspirillum sp. RTI4]|uniref:oxepin-CoA hydrolase, alternative type n=1 Tax=Herbaspirillum sp. RTI4 TaxID=3048640 RepID=UPI002AB3382A|nr:enoyl-CoA hydratase [Herbaspirillum sp. RTI4]MDY7577096.1 enoyl-CoA hydratase [Herbaspirillum sp. RTI4]MEA9982276.1 enoyl-CoA hydratase [Herbaspirillum sp. RTI4]
MSDAVLIAQQGAVRILTNNNPAARNAITAALYTELAAALSAAESDPGVGAIVLTGAGDFFCSGGDLKQLATRRELPVPQRREKIENLHNLIRAIRRCSKPVVAAVEGGAAGAGLSLALCCDMLVSARNALFSAAYVKVGLTPDGGATAFLAEFVSRQILTELCLTGERISGERLHALGAVNRLAEPGAALTDAIALAQQIATGPLRATARIKQLCQHAYGADLEAQMELEATLMAVSQGDDEAAEGIASFFAKRPADFVTLRGKPNGS